MEEKEEGKRPSRTPRLPPKYEENELLNSLAMKNLLLSQHKEIFRRKVKIKISQLEEPKMKVIYR